MNNINPLIKLHNIAKIYQVADNTICALKNISLTINQGEFVAIMGQSGSGKSTLMNIIGCLDQPSSGSYTISDTKINTLSPNQLANLRCHKFGFIFQRYNLLPHLTAQENIEVPAIYARTNKSQRNQKSLELLNMVGLANRKNHKPAKLSGGQQQRIAIARALINNPSIILADEPTGALDSKSGAEILDLLKHLNSQGHTIILITHDKNVAAYAQRIIHLQDGQITKQHQNTHYTSNPNQTSDTIKNIPNLETKYINIFSESLKIALHSLRNNLFRTILTLLGIIIGVSSVIDMLAIGEGSKQKILDMINAMGTDLLSIRTGAPGIRSTGDITTLTPQDAKEISYLPNVAAAIPEQSNRYTARYRNIDYMTTIQGGNEEFATIRNWNTQAGNFFSQQDVRSYATTAILGTTVKNNLFPNSNPIGQYIQIKNIPFQVIAILEEKGSNSWGMDQDDIIIIPYTTSMIRLSGMNYLSSITVKVNDINLINNTENAIFNLLKSRHHVEDFNIRNAASILQTANQTQDTLTILLASVAAISLIVGGIGVMNIMLVSVTERTKEIGLRIATGARISDILIQFNIESTVLCAIGGIIGVVLGFFIGIILTSFGIVIIFTKAPPILAFSCSLIVGIIFGYLPAKKASKLDPVIALATE